MDCPQCQETMNHCSADNDEHEIGYYCDHCKKFFFHDELEWEHDFSEGEFE